MSKSIELLFRSSLCLGRAPGSEAILCAKLLPLISSGIRDKLFVYHLFLKYTFPQLLIVGGRGPHKFWEHSMETVGSRKLAGHRGRGLHLFFGMISKDGFEEGVDGLPI